MLPFQRKKVDLTSMNEEEKKLFARYGTLPTHKNILSKVQKDRKYFDSGDYAMSKAGVTPQSNVGTAIPSPTTIPHPTPSPHPPKAKTDPSPNPDSKESLSIVPPGTAVVIPAPQNSPPAHSSPIKESISVEAE